MSSESDTTLAAIAHVLGLFTSVLGPAVLYFVSDDEFVRQNAATAIDWQIFFTVYFTIAVILAVVLIGFVLAPLLMLVDFAFCLIAAKKASEGETWSYPATIPIVA